MKNINPLTDIGCELQSVQNPARYIGGESGIIRKDSADLTFIMAFPDVYEIGMCNQAVKIIYNGLNRLDAVRCERVFAPDTEFEDLLRKKNIPLYSLETGIPLKDADVVGFSLGYELGITNVLAMLDCGRIPVCKTDRSENDPIVIAGGCGTTNPAPYSMFFDAFFIGEAENLLFELMEQTAALKKEGAGRSDLLKFISGCPSVWIPGKKTVKAYFAEFGQEEAEPAYSPVPAVKPVQEHGVVEIMRGCPNGCRFCHAGIYYRPQRIKKVEHIIRETDRLVFEAGYREISLTSLSSGDYENIGQLLDILNERYKNMHVSFQLPSLKVSTFNLPILEKLSQVRKSGLTFAVETPVESWQFSLNKEVLEEKLVDIIMNAKQRGWNKAKFYFMIGLPVEEEGRKEEEEIVDFLIKIQQATHIQCSVNIGTFIPKPHTPYQWAKQLSMEEAERKMSFIRYSLPKGKFKVSTHDIFVSFIEGMISRGDERTGSVILEAFKNGCRMDAWDDKIKKDMWVKAVNSVDWNVKEYVYNERTLDEKLPWDDISLGPSKSFYIRELERSRKMMMTKPCDTVCTEFCGVCKPQNNKTISSIHSDFVLNNIQLKNIKVYKPIQFNNIYNIPYPSGYYSIPDNQPQINIPVLYRCVFLFTKKDGGELLPHLALQEAFHKAFLRSSLPVLFSTGFNPVPRLELASTLSLGIISEEETASCVLRECIDADVFIQQMNKNLPLFIRVSYAYIFPVTLKRKRESLASLLWGASYVYTFFTESDFKINEFLLSISEEKYKPHQSSVILQDGKTIMSVILRFSGDRSFRDAMSSYFNKPLYELCSVTRKTVLASFEGQNGSYADAMPYIQLFKNIAQENQKIFDQDGIQV